VGSEIRRSQLISPFGPGSIYVDKYGVPTVICGLDYWFKHYADDTFKDNTKLQEICSINEPRLQSLLRIPELREPPIYTTNSQVDELKKVMVQGHRFPRWYVNSQDRTLARFNLETRKISAKGIWKPVRFMAVCSQGHLADFPWKSWVGCDCAGESGLKLKDGGGGDLSSIRVHCENCNKSETLRGALRAGSEETLSGLASRGIACDGERPWLGEGGRDHVCEAQLTGVLVNQSNVYFPNTISSIYLPPTESEKDVSEIIEVLVSSDWAVTKAKVYLDMGDDDVFYDKLRKLLSDNGFECSNETILRAYNTLSGGNKMPDERPVCASDSELLAFRRAEYNTIRNEVPEDLSSELRVVTTEVDEGLTGYVSRVNLVERLRETRVFCGFDRLERQPIDLGAMPGKALNQLFRHPPHELHKQWLPAVKNYGEGIYIELNEDSIQKWLDRNSDMLKSRYDEAFVLRMSSEEILLPPRNNCDWRWVAKYQLVHTLSHVLINQVVFDCGYSSASLKERLFISNDENHPMSGFLVYTASGDSEGSLGGLVNLARKEMFVETLSKALNKAIWCSADPVCSENISSRGSRLVNKAACHACALLPETACETINNGLDRAAVVGLPEDPSLGYFGSFLRK
jgi:hypothetical protein